MRELKFVSTGVATLVLLVMCGGESSNDDHTSSSGGTGAGTGGSANGGTAGSGGSPPDSSGWGGRGGGIIIPDSSIDYMSPNPYLDAGEDQWCAPEPGPGAVTSCCGGAPCNGGCLTSGASKTCDCFAIAGGCPPGLICCLIKKGCTAAGSCQPGF